MRKKYISKSQISLSVSFPNGGKKHISFEPKSDGGSVYYTDDPNEQIALESHYNFGAYYKLDEEFDDKPIIAEVSEPEIIEEPKSGKTEIQVSDLASAKDYLCDRFGYSRTKLRGRNSILEAAAKENIEFIGIE